MRARDKVAAPHCPFCDAELARPAAMNIGEVEQVQGGTCGCGAIYLVDPTGKNVGLVMSQALGLVADRLKKKFTQLDPEADYADAVLSYDARTHRSTGVSQGYMDGYGRLYVVRVNTPSAG